MGLTSDTVRSVLTASVKSTAHLFLIVGTGIYLAKRDIITREGRRTVGKFVFELALPCLLFSRLSPAVSPENLAKWWAIPVSALLWTAVALLIAVLLCHFLRIPRSLRGAVVAASTFGNSGALPILMMTTLPDTFGPMMSDPDAEEKGVALVSLFLVFVTILMFSLGFWLLTEDSHDSTAQQNESDRVELVSVQRDGETIHERIEIDGEVEGDVEDADDAAESLHTTAPPRLTLLDRVKRITNPPFIAILIAVVFGLVPFLRDGFLDEGAPLRTIWQASYTIGTATIPLSAILLGCSLFHSFQEKRAGAPQHAKEIAITVFIRNFAMPCIGILVTYVMLRQNAIGSDPLVPFMMALQANTPTANNMVLICVLANNLPGLRLISQAALMQYLIAPFSFTFFCAAALYIAYPS